MKYLCNLLYCPFAVLLGIAGISVFSLVAALFAEVALGMEPCIMCIYQRIPFVIAFVLSVIGLIWAKINKDTGKKASTAIIGLSGVTFLVNSGIAFYHTGIERKWWVSAVEGCAVPNFGDEPQSMLENILSAPTARCDEIPWADPIIGLSMANYNVILCFGLFVVCTLAVVKQRQRRLEQQTDQEPNQSEK